MLIQVGIKVMCCGNDMYGGKGRSSNDATHAAKLKEKIAMLKSLCQDKGGTLQVIVCIPPSDCL